MGSWARCLRDLIDFCLLFFQFFFEIHFGTVYTWPKIWSKDLVYGYKVWLFEKFIFELEAFWDSSEINSILVRQLKSFKKMIVSSVKLISWSPIYVPLILVLASMKIASTSATIMHNNIESRQPSWNPWMRVKDS